jgi:hypothetical protein
MSIMQYNPKAKRRMPLGMRTDMLYRIPGRDHRTEITHKLPKDMNRKEWRAVLKAMT